MWTNYDNFQYCMQQLHWMLNAYLSDRKRGNILVIVWAAVSLITWPDKLWEREKNTMIMLYRNGVKNIQLLWPGEKKKWNGKKNSLKVVFFLANQI